MNLQKFVFLGDNQQLTALQQLLTIPSTERTLEQSVIISWYFRNELGINLTKQEADEMNFEKYSNFIKKDNIYK